MREIRDRRKGIKDKEERLSIPTIRGFKPESLATIDYQGTKLGFRKGSY